MKFQKEREVQRILLRSKHLKNEGKKKKNGCRIRSDKTGLGVLIKEGEEWKRALLCKRKFLKRKVLAKKRGDSYIMHFPSRPKREKT